MELFKISCTTCKARIKVHDESVIGQILSCPKCESMVQIIPPPDWQPENQPPISQDPSPQGEAVQGDAVAAQSESATAAPQTDPTGADLLIPSLAMPATPSFWSQWFSKPWQKWAVLGGASGVLLVAVGMWVYFGPNNSIPGAASKFQEADTPSDPAGKTARIEPREKTLEQPEADVGPLSIRQPEPIENPSKNDPIKVAPAIVNPLAQDAAIKPPAVVEVKPNKPPAENDPGAKKQPVIPEPKDPAAALLSELPLFEGETPWIDGLEPLDAENEKKASKTKTPAAASKNKQKTDGIPRPPLAKIDVNERFAEKLIGIEFEKVRLSDFIETLSDLSTVPITIDLDSLWAIGVRPGSFVKVDFKNVTLGHVLSRVLATKKLRYLVADSQVIVGAAAQYDSPLIPMPYSIADLTGNDEQALTELADTIRRLVEQKSWTAFGGPGTIEVVGGKLVISQTLSMHHRILVFCEKLRVARGLKPLSRWNHSLFELKTRTEQARKNLTKPVTANYYLPRRLTRNIRFLEEVTGMDILVDWQALRAENIGRDLETTLVAKQQPLSIALEKMLLPVGLSFRVIDARTLQITTRKAAAASMELEFYPVGDLLGNELEAKGGLNAEGLVKRVQTSVARDSWDGAGADGHGEIYFDPAAKCLVVAQSQQVHRLLQQQLSQWRAGQ